MCGTIGIYGQDDQIFINPETYPEYPGGEIALFEFMMENFEYHDNENVYLTRIFFSLNIDTSGVPKFDSILKITEGVNKENIEMELKRIVGLMPKWSPGRQSGIKVPMKMTIPLRIELR